MTRVDPTAHESANARSQSVVSAPAPTATPNVSNVSFTQASYSLQSTGLCGWIGCLINGLRVDGITLRTTRGGKLALTYPARRDRLGDEHPYVLPDGESARQSIEDQVFAALESQGYLE